MKTYETIAEAMNDLAKRGYNYDFRQIKRDHADWLENNTALRPEEFVIDELHRFEGKTDPSDETILFAISSPKHQVKGTLVSAYGAYADGVAELASKLPEPQKARPEKQLKPG